MLYITYVKIVKINIGEKVQVLNNVIAIILGSIIAFFEWDTICNDGWYLYFIGLVVICSILPVYMIVKRYVI